MDKHSKEYELMCLTETLHDEHKPTQQIALEVMRDVDWVEKSILIMKNLSEEALTYLREGHMSRGAALAIAQIEPERRINVFRRAVEKFNAM